MTELLRMVLEQGGAEKVYSVRLLQRFGQVDPYLTPAKIQELWIEYSKYDTLFSDYTLGKVDPFLDIMLASNAVIAEIYNVTDEVPIGSAMGTRILVGFDAQAHFTLWDSKAKGMEPIFHEIMRMWMTEFKLHRVSCETPGFMKGVIRMVKRLGFVHEGTRREGSIHKGGWVDLEMFGMTADELQQKMQEVA